MRGEGIAKLYQNGGPKLLAYRLGRIFTKIETPEQTALHNDVLAEVLDIINKDYPKDNKATQEEYGLLMFIADFLLYKTRRQKRFLFRLAEKILKMGQMK